MSSAICVLWMRPLFAKPGRRTKTPKGRTDSTVAWWMLREEPVRGWLGAWSGEFSVMANKEGKDRDEIAMEKWALGFSRPAPVERGRVRVAFPLPRRAAPASAAAEGRPSLERRPAAHRRRPGERGRAAARRARELTGAARRGAREVPAPVFVSGVAAAVPVAVGRAAAAAPAAVAVSVAAAGAVPPPVALVAAAAVAVAAAASVPLRAARAPEATAGRRRGEAEREI